MKVTIYELLGLMLKRQAPKKIEVLGFTMNYVKNAHWGDYEDEETHIRLSSFRLNECLNEEVEVCSTGLTVKEAEENFYKISEALYKEANKKREKEIPEKLDDDEYEYNTANEILFMRKINEILDYLKSKGDE